MPRKARPVTATLGIILAVWSSCHPREMTAAAFVPVVSASSVPQCRTTTWLAKPKKSTKKTSSNKQQSGFEWATSFTSKPYEAQASRDLVSKAVASFAGRTGKPLCEQVAAAADIPKAMWKAPVACVILSKDNDDNANNELNSFVRYANVAALETVGLGQEELQRLVVMPRPNNDNNEGEDGSLIILDLPTEMKDQKYQGGYNKKILRRGQGKGDISILNAQRWVLEQSAVQDGAFVTQEFAIAYSWEEWCVDEGDDAPTMICSPGGAHREMVNVQELQSSVEEQAAHVRHLKQEQGLTNQDPLVKQAVAKLIELKALLEANS